MHCGLLGRTLGHSYSPQIHGCLGSYSYELFEKEPEELEDFLKNGDFHGINVTIPYKKAVIPYLDELSPVAQRMGAVNTIVRRADGSLWGHNTDFYGFSDMVRESGLEVSAKKVLVLGSGGASASAVQALLDLGAEVIVISRGGENNYENLEKHRDAKVIVNTTPLGMYPKNGVAAVELDAFPQLEGVLDVVYNPQKTKLILEAEKRGYKTGSGLWMLVAQAKESAEYFTGTEIPVEKIREIHGLLRRQMENIVLIGMPGCGKSTLGKAVAQRLHRRFVDADAEIVALAGKSIPAVFAEDGEEAFRKLETRVLETLGKESGLVIATGGGCVTREENYAPLHQNGKIFWILRELSALPTEGRPLSQQQKLEEMYAVRKPLYERFADIIVDNSTAVEQTLENLLRMGGFM